MRLVIEIEIDNNDISNHEGLKLDRTSSYFERCMETQILEAVGEAMSEHCNKDYTDVGIDLKFKLEH